MKSNLKLRQYFWILFVFLLVACGPLVPAQTATPTATSAPAYTALPTFTPVVGMPTPLPTYTPILVPTFDTKYQPPTSTLLPTYTALPIPTATPIVPYTSDRFRKVFIKDGNLYVQDGNKPLKQLTHSGKDRDPIISSDGEKIVFYRGKENDNVYSINADGSREKLIIKRKSLPVLGRGEIKALIFNPVSHFLLFNTYLCNPRPIRPSYNAPDCTVGIYSVDTDSGEIRNPVGGLSGNTMQDRNFDVSPNGRYISVASSGHVDLYLSNGGDIVYTAISYPRTKPDEFLPLQYWLPDSSGLIIVIATDSYNEPGTPPATFAAFRYRLGGTAVQIPLGATIMRGDMGCHVLISPDRNWIYFAGNETGNIQGRLYSYFANLNDGHTQQYESLGPCFSLKWSPDSKHLASGPSMNDVIGSIDGPPVDVGGTFIDWLDATHYLYMTGDSVDTLKTFIGEIGGASIPVPEGFNWLPTFVVMPPTTEP